MVSTMISTRDEFKNEFIRRIFKPESYFFKCLSRQLQNGLTKEKALTETDYLLIGQVIQAQNEAEQPIETLQRLNLLAPFAAFFRSLDISIELFAQAGVSRNEMKGAIEHLARNFTIGLVQCLQEPDGHEKLNRSLNNQPFEVPSAEIEVVDDEEIVFQEFGVQPSAPVETEAKNGHAAPAPVRPGTVEELAPAEQTPEAPAAVEELPLAGENSGILAAPETFQVLPEENMPGVEADSMDPASLPREPAELKNAFLTEARGHLEAIRDLVLRLKANKACLSELKELKHLFLSLRESSMIHGFEEPEDISRKGQQLTEKLLHQRWPLTEDLVKLYKSLPACYKLAMGMQADAAIEAGFRQCAEQLNLALAKPFSYIYDSRNAACSEPDRVPAAAQEDSPGAKPVAPPSANPEPVETAAVKPADPRHKSAPASEPTPVLRTKPTDAPLEHFEVNGNGKGNGSMEKVDLDLRLPGEDDPELQKLVREAAQERSQALEDAVRTRNGHAARPSIQKAAPAPQAVNGKRAKAAAKAEMKEAVVGQYQEEAGLYFQVGLEAIRKLMQNPEDRLSMENLELAAYSMKGVAKKLELKAFAYFPDMLEELIGKLIANEQAMPENLMKQIDKGITILQSAPNEKVLGRKEFKRTENALLRFINSLRELRQSESKTEVHLTFG